MDHIINSIVDVLKELPEAKMKEVLQFAQFVQHQERLKVQQAVKKGNCNHLEEMEENVETPDELLKLDIE